MTNTHIVATTWLAARWPVLRRAGVLAAVLAAATLLTPATGSADPDVAAARQRLEALQAQLSGLTQQLDAAAAAYENAQAHHLRLSAELADSDEVIEGARAQAAAVESAFHARVAGVYKRPGTEVALAEAVLLAPDAATAMHRAALIGMVTVRGAAQVRQAEQAQAVTVDTVRQHQVVFAGANGAAADMQRLAEQLTLVVQSAQHQVSAASRAVTAAEQAAARRLVVAAGPVNAEGKVCPIGRPHGFIDSWGFPRPGGRSHQGVDMFASYGMPLYAVADGVVQQVGTNRLGGLYVNLFDQAGNRYYYAHLSAAHVVTGQRVVAGQVIGANGDSGNARGTPPHLHWQYHPGNGPPVNPYPLAHALCRGGSS